MANKDHLSKLSEGADLWNKWRSQNPNIQPDLTRAHLCGRDLSGFNLSNSYLVGADLRKTDLKQSCLYEADFTEANLCGADFTFANLDRAKLVRTDLTDAYLTGVTLVRANLTQANLRGVSMTAATLTEATLTDIQWDRRRMRRKFRGISGLDSSHGNALFKRDVADQDFLDTLEAHWRNSWRIILFWAWGLFDYGRSLGRIFIAASILVAGYGLVYTLFPDLLDWTHSAKSVFSPFYFSIVTYTTLGFGDVTPCSLAGEIIVSTEVVLGYTTLGLLLSVLAEKLARRA